MEKINQLLKEWQLTRQFNDCDMGLDEGVLWIRSNLPVDNLISLYHVGSLPETLLAVSFRVQALITAGVSEVAFVDLGYSVNLETQEVYRL